MMSAQREEDMIAALKEHTKAINAHTAALERHGHQMERFIRLAPSPRKY